jgi:uncharacterized membrane protein
MWTVGIALLGSSECNRTEERRKIMASSKARKTMESIQDESVNVGKVERYASVLGGGVLAVYGLSRRSLSSVPLVIGGGALLHRGITGRCKAYETLGISTAGNGQALEKTVTIHASPGELYRFWRKLENLPQFMHHLESVRTEGNRSHWVAKAPMGMEVEWDAEITQDRENEIIAWRSLEGSQVEQEGSVQFKPAPGGRGTEVKVNIKYRIPGGKAGSAIASIFGREPEQQVADELRRFKQLMEAGEIATAGKQTGSIEDLEGTVVHSPRETTVPSS